MVTAEQSIKSFSVRHRPDVARGERVTWSCIDERTLLLRGLLLERTVRNERITLLDRRNATNQSLFYKQTAAGPFGLGQDINTSLRLAKLRNRHTDTGAAAVASARHNARAAEQAKPRHSIPPSYVLGSMAAKALRAEGVDLLAHEGCAAEMAAGPISQGIATNTGPNGEDIYEAIKDLYPGGLKRARFNDISGVYGDALADGMVAPLAESTPAIDQGADTRLAVEKNMCLR